MRKLFGFVIGSVGTLVLMSVIFSSMGIMLRGPFWLFICIAAGLISARFLASPHDTFNSVAEVVVTKTQPVSSRWWVLDERLRLVLVVSFVWVIASFLIQDRWERDMRIVLIPALALIALHFAERKLVQKTKNVPTQASPGHSTDEC
jgi:hypothetical protein